MSDLGQFLLGSVGPFIREYFPALTPLVLAFGIYVTYRQLTHNRRVLEIQVRNESLKKVTELYEKLYQIDSMSQQTRVDFEYNFYQKWAPVIEKRLVYQKILTEPETRILADVNRVLNFFEHVAHSESRAKGHSLLRIEDTDAVFDFWYNVVMTKDSHAILRRYLNYGYEHIRRRTGISAEPVYLAAYGTLMPGEDNRLAAEVSSRLISIGPCKIPGTLYNVGPEWRYPGLKEAEPYKEQFVVGELFEMGKDDDAARHTIQYLDEYERFYQNRDKESEYVRRYILVSEPEPGSWAESGGRRGAWVYFHQGDPRSDRMQIIESGNWRNRSAVQPSRKP